MAMTLRPETEDYLTAVEHRQGKKFRHRADVGMIIDAADASAAFGEFERIVFLAKFITNAFSILRRSGVSSEETTNLARELETSLREIAERFRGLLAGGVDASAASRFDHQFLTLSKASMESLQELLSELTWVKNLMLDGDSPPIRSSASA